MDGVGGSRVPGHTAPCRQQEEPGLYPMSSGKPSMGFKQQQLHQDVFLEDISSGGFRRMLNIEAIIVAQVR